MDVGRQNGPAITTPVDRFPTLSLMKFLHYFAAMATAYGIWIPVNHLQGFKRS
jgi:hypothetical protein